MDFRLIPNIQPADAIRKLKAHLEKHDFGHIEVQAYDGAEPPYKISVKEDISQAIIAAATEVYGELPVGEWRVRRRRYPAPRLDPLRPDRLR